MITWFFNLNFFNTLKYQVDSGPGILTITGTIFAVLMAMLIIDVNNRYYEAQKCIINEADYVGSIFLSSLNLPAPESKEVICLLKGYLNFVIQQEIPAQDINHQKIDLLRVHGFQYVLKISHIIINSKMPDAFKSQVLNSLDLLSNQRRLRISTTEAQLLPFLWVVLSVSWLVLIINVSLMDVKKTNSIYLFNILISLVIGIMVVFLIKYNLPFSGSHKLNIKPYNHILDIINNQVQQNNQKLVSWT